jgi:hypothetical protein
MRSVLFAGTMLVVSSMGVGVSVPAQECALEVPEWAPRGSASSARPRITATLTSTCGAAIDLSSIRMTLDDEAVMPTPDGTGSQVTVTFTPASALLAESDHTVTVQARDAKGTKGEKTWAFHLGDTYSR